MSVQVDHFTFPANIWYEGHQIDISFPPPWEVETYPMEGDGASPITDKEIEERITDPIGCPTIREGAAQAESAIILIDDLTRPTKASRIAPIVLKQLKRAQVPKESIRFMVAQGAHRSLTRLDYVEKLGEEIVDQYPVYSHNPFHNCTRLGTTSYGTPVEVNQEVMSCDYKIGIGGIVPHPQMGFGGGGKIINPGVSSIESIRKNHYHSISPKGEVEQGAGWGNYEENAHRKDVEEIVEMAGLDFKIDALFNCRGEATHLFCGDPILEHRKGVEKARRHYSTPSPSRQVDVIVAGAHCKASEAGLVIGQTRQFLKPGGTLVIATNPPQGFAPHYLYGRWGKSRIGGFDWREKKSLPEKVGKLIVFTQCIDRGGSWWFGPEDGFDWVENWEDVLEKIGKDEPKKVALYPDGTIQLLK